MNPLIEALIILAPFALGVLLMAPPERKNK